ALSWFLGARPRRYDACRPKTRRCPREWTAGLPDRSPVVRRDRTRAAPARHSFCVAAPQNRKEHSMGVATSNRVSSTGSRKHRRPAPDILGTEQNFRSLSIRDLLLARDLYHYHLMNRPNVVGTAVGLYLIRNADDDAGRPAAAESHGERTFRNSSVRDYSWPCVLVMVREWARGDEFGTGREYHPEDMVP